MLPTVTAVIEARAGLALECFPSVVVAAMMVYNLGAVVLLVYAGIGLGLHAVMGAGCLMGLKPFKGQAIPH